MAERLHEALTRQEICEYMLMINPEPKNNLDRDSVTEYGAL